MGDKVWFIIYLFRLWNIEKRNWRHINLILFIILFIPWRLGIAEWNKHDTKCYYISNHLKLFSMQSMSVSIFFHLWLQFVYHFQSVGCINAILHRALCMSFKKQFCCHLIVYCKVNEEEGKKHMTSPSKWARKI